MHKAAAHAKHGLPLRHLPAMDLPFLVLVLTLVGFGLVMLGSASSAVALYRRGDAFAYLRPQLLYAALADAEALEPSRALYEEGLTGMEQEFEQYMKAVKLLEDSGVPQEVLKKEKAEVYEQLSEVNREIRAEREKLKLCREICRQTPVMEQDIQKTEEHQKEVREHEHRRR